MQTGRGFVLLPSYYEALRGLPDEERLALYDAMLDFGFQGKEPDLSDPMERAVFALLRPTIQSSVEKYEAQCRNGSKGGRRRTKDDTTETQAEPNSNPTETQVEPNSNPTETQVKPNSNPTETQTEPKGKREKEKENDKEYENEKDMDREWDTDKETLRAYRADEPPRAARFTAPTTEEVSSYCQERRNRVDAERFVDFYTSKGWRVGNQPMKDWRSAVRTWEKRDAAGHPRPFDIRDPACYTYEEGESL